MDYQEFAAIRESFQAYFNMPLSVFWGELGFDIIGFEAWMFDRKNDPLAEGESLKQGVVRKYGQNACSLIEQILSIGTKLCMAIGGVVDGKNVIVAVPSKDGDIVKPKIIEKPKIVGVFCAKKGSITHIPSGLFVVDAPNQKTAGQWMKVFNTIDGIDSKFPDKTALKELAKIISDCKFRGE